MLLGPCVAQFAGSWGTPFDHEVSRASAPNPNATDPGSPFGGLDAMTFYQVSGATYGWPGQPNDIISPFEAVHMALIPKGVNRGKVLVWNILPVLAAMPVFDPNPPAGTEWWACQGYAIVDPAISPSGLPRFQNFLLPIERVDPTAPGYAMSTPPASDLFCSGHAWTRFGDLAVFGGTTFDSQAGTFAGPKMTYVFNPARLTMSFPLPGFTLPLYGATAQGLWVRGPDLQTGRWYPTATLTSRLLRLVDPTNPLGREVMLVAGGSARHPGATYLNSPGWNTYEAFVVNSGCVAGNPGIVADSTGTPPNQIFEWIGPGTVPPPPTAPPFREDWLLEYPRTHWLSGHRAFVSGYAPRGARLDHELPGTWTSLGLPYSSNWQVPRHDGSSVLFAKAGDLQDVVMRFGGSDREETLAGARTTETVEVSFGGGPWFALAPMPATDGAMNGGRFHMNTLVLPTGAVLVLGGQNGQDGQPMISPMIYVLGSWHVDLPNAVFSNRMYHATAVLLPDGRVMLGGGDQRNYDYEIYSPYYLHLPGNHKPVNLTFQAPVPLFDLTYDAYELHHLSQYVIHCNPITAPNVAVEKAVLMSPGSMTHSSDMHQRYVDLTATVTGTNQVQFTVPAEDLAPRGLYMLWLVTNTGAVSDAVWVVLQ